MNINYDIIYEKTQKFISEIKEITDNLIDSEKHRYVGTDKWIVVLEKTEDTITSENSNYINENNKATALYWGDTFKVIKIINKFNSHTNTSAITFSVGSFEVKYVVGTNVKFPMYCDKETNTQMGGMSFYMSVEPAYYSNINTDDYEGYFKVWTISGSLKEEGVFINGKIFGVWKFYFPTGQLDAEQTYINNLLCGEDKEYSIEGNLLTKGHFEKDLKVGEWFRYNKKLSEVSDIFNSEDDNYLVRIMETYVDDILNGPYVVLNETNDINMFKVCIAGTYENNEKHGLWVSYHKNGHAKTIEHYKNGVKYGSSVEYFDSDMRVRSNTYSVNLRDNIQNNTESRKRKASEVDSE